MNEGLAFSRRKALLAPLVLLGALRGSTALADEPYPDHPIRLIVPYPPGGPTDVMGRLIGQVMSQSLGKQVFVDNRPGAGSTLAGKIAVSADPDGYTLLIGSAATLAIGPTLYKGVEYDPRSFVPVAPIATVPYVMIGGPKSPFATAREVVAYAKAHPGKLTIGVPNGAPPHMLAAWFKSLTATDILVVPYKGASTEITDLIGGQIEVT